MLHVIAVLVASLCFATTGTAQALGGLDASPAAVGAARGLLGGCLLALIAWRMHRRSSAAPPWLASVRDARVPVALGVVGVLAYNALFFAGTALNGVAIGTVVTIGSAPVAAGLIEALVLRKPPPVRWILATAVAIAGVVLVSGLLSIGASQGSVSVPGLLVSMGAGYSYALFTVASKSLFERRWSATTATGTVFGLAGLLGLPILIFTDTAWLWTPHGLAVTLWLGVITVAFAYTLWSWGLTGLRSTTVTTLTLAEPMGATLLGLFVLGERLDGAAALGIALIALGLVIVATPPRPQASSVTVTEANSSYESGPV